jgi:hypothetical protein
MTDAASALGIDRRDIYWVCKGDRISAGGFRFEFNGGNKIARWVMGITHRVFWRWYNKAAVTNLVSANITKTLVFFDE